MASIHILDPLLSNKIAAGEVVERPSNVVKELVENALDADATKIDIVVKQGGLELIKIQDNGKGMGFEDLSLCLSRHATSKIQDEHDLMRIGTLGFRGEALPSIASVSHMVIQTTAQNDGGHLEATNGKVDVLVQGQFRQGTTIEVTQLFQNVPARLKYIKSIKQEYAQIHDLIQRFSFSYPNVAFTFVHDDRLIYQTSGSGQLLPIIDQIYGQEVALKMIKVETNNHDFKLDGYVSKIDVNRSNKKHIHLLVNNRLIKDRRLIDVVSQAYRHLLADDRYPIALLSITMDPYLVDVNVHPSKWEVRFSSSDHLFLFLLESIKDKLKQVDLTYQVYHQPKPVQPIIEQPSLVLETVVKESIPEYKATPMVETVVEKSETKPLEMIKKPQIDLQPIGQIHGTYIVAQSHDGMYLIDQHAAQERIYFEYFEHQFASKSLTDVYQLLVPIMVNLTPIEATTITQHLDDLKTVGIELEPFGDQTFRCHQLPVWMDKIDEQRYIDNMIDAILAKKHMHIHDLQKEAIASLSCKASIKANHHLSSYEMKTLLDDLMRCETPYVCPHGRPTVIHYTAYELEKLFKRVV